MIYMIYYMIYDILVWYDIWYDMIYDIYDMIQDFPTKILQALLHNLCSQEVGAVGNDTEIFGR
jgi:hypothetical protein